MKIKLLFVLLISSYIYTQNYNERGRDEYERLHLSSNASEQEVKNTCRKLMFKYHPDKFPESQKSGAQDIFVKINNDCDYVKGWAKKEEYSYREPEYHKTEETHQSEKKHSSHHRTTDNNFFNDDFNEFFERFKKQQEEREKDRQYWEQYQEFQRKQYERNHFSYSDQQSRYGSSENFRGVYHTLYSPLFDLSLRQSYAQFHTDKPFYGTASVVPCYSYVKTHLSAFGPTSGNLESHIYGGLLNVLAGYKALWLQFVALVGQDEEKMRFDTNNLRVSQAGFLNEILYFGYQGTFFEGRYKLRYYGFASLPGQRHSRNAGNAILVAGSPFYSFGFGSDGILQIYEQNTTNIVCFVNSRFQYFKKTYVDSYKLEETPRLDILVGLRGCFDNFEIEVGEDFISQAVHNYSENLAAQTYLLFNYRKNDFTFSLGGSSTYSLDDNKTLGFGGWVNLGYIF